MTIPIRSNWLLGNKQNITDLGDLTLSITPYEDILSIPDYQKLRDEYNATVMLGADISVENSKGKREKISALSDINRTISGVILDKHNEINATNLKYYYYDGSDWIEDGNITEGGSLTLNDKFRLVPYVIAKPNDMTTKTITVEGLDNIKSPVVVAKTKVVSTTQTASKILNKTLGESMVVDATTNINGNQVEFRVPNGFDIDELVVLGEEIHKITDEDKSSISVQVEANTTSLTSQLPIITDTTVINEVKNNLIYNIHIEKLYDAFELPYYEEISQITETSTDKQKAFYILGVNIANFIGTPLSTQNSFYTGEDQNISQTISWTEKYDDNTTKRTRSIAVNKDTQTISREETGYDQDSGKKTYTKTQTLKFTNGKIVKNTKKVYSSENIGTTEYYYNKAGTTYTNEVVYNKVDANTTNYNFYDRQSL